MNLFLLLKWYQCREESPCYFVDLFSSSDDRPPTPEEVEQFWSLNLWKDPGSEPLVKKPVVFSICRSNHYFTVYFDYLAEEAWVFGRDYSIQKPRWERNASWTDWSGALYWNKIAGLFRWSVMSESPTSITTFDFPQVPDFFLVTLEAFNHSNTFNSERIGLWAICYEHRVTSDGIRIERSPDATS
jgi:hypothetical protein